MTNAQPEATPSEELPAESKPPERKPRTGRRVLWLALLTAIVVCALTYASWLPPLAESIAPAIAGRFGYALRIDGIQRLDLGGLSLTGLRLDRSGAGGPLEHFSAATVDARFDTQLLKGNLDGLHDVRARGVHIQIVPTTPASPPVPAQSAGTFVWPNRLPTIQLMEVKLELPGTPDQSPILIEHLGLNKDGQLALRLQAMENDLQVQGRWQLGVLEDLQCQVNGLDLLQDSELDLSKIGAGALEARAQFAIGSESQAISVSLDGSKLQWTAVLRGLDLAELEQRSPIALNTNQSGTLHLESTGSLNLEDPSDITASVLAKGTALEFHGVQLDHLQGQLQLRDGVLRVPTLIVRQSEDNHCEIRGARLPLDGLDPSTWLQHSSAEIRLVIEDAASLLAYGRDPDLPPVHLVEHRFALTANLGDNRLDLIECGLESAAGGVEFTRASLNLTNFKHLVLEAQGNANLHDLTAIGALLGRDNWGGSLTGDLQLSGSWPDVECTVRLAGDELLLENVPLGRLDLEVYTQALGQDLELTRLHLETEHGQVDARCGFEFGSPVAIDLRALDLHRNDQSLSLQAPLQILVGPDAGSFEQLLLKGSAGQLALAGSWSGQEFDLILSVDRVSPALLNDPQLASLPTIGETRFSLLAQRTAQELTFQSSGQFLNLHTPASSERLDLEWDVSFREDRLRVERLQGTGRGALGFTISGDLPLDLASGPELPEGAVGFSIDAKMPLDVLQEGATGVITAKGELGGTWRALTGALDVVARQVRLGPALHPEALDNADLSGRIVLDQGVRVENTTLALGEFLRGSIDGQLLASLDVTRWLDDREAVLKESRLQGKLELTELDIKNLRPILKGLSEAAGPLREGRLSTHLALGGSLSDPVISGRLNLVDGRVRPGGGLPPVEDVQANLELVGEQILVHEMSGTLGAAPFEIDGQVQRTPEGALLDLHIAGRDLLLLRDANARLRADTDLRITGPLEQLLVKGSVELTTGHYAPNIRFLNLQQGPASAGVQGFQLFALRDAPLRDMQFDIQLGSQEPFEIHNSIIRGSMRPDLHLGGSGLVPLLTGTVYLEPTRLKLPASDLELSSGTIRFLEENPFVPQLDILGNTRMLGYDIRADITGPYDEPELLLTSTPPLAQEDLFLLLLTGRLPDDPDRTDAVSTANTVVIYLANDTLARWFEDDGPLDEDAILERLEFSVGQDVSKNGTETFDVLYRLSDRTGKPRATRDARHHYLAVERDKYEDYNFGLRWVFRFRR